MFSMFIKSRPSMIKSRQDIFVNIYTNLNDAWNESKDLSKCIVQIDVSQFPEKVDEWVKVINSHLHFYNRVKFNIKAFKSEKPSFFKNVELLNVELLEIPEIFSGSMQA